MNPLDRLKHHVTGAIERGEATAVTEQPGATAAMQERIAALEEALAFAATQLLDLASGYPQKELIEPLYETLARAQRLIDVLSCRHIG